MFVAFAYVLFFDIIETVLKPLLAAGVSDKLQKSNGHFCSGASFEQERAAWTQETIKRFSYSPPGVALLISPGSRSWPEQPAFLRPLSQGAGLQLWDDSLTLTS